MRPEQLLYNMALAAFTKQAMDPAMAAELAAHIPTLMGMGGGALAAGKGRRMVGATMGGLAGEIGAHVGAGAAPEIHHELAKEMFIKQHPELVHMLGGASSEHLTPFAQAQEYAMAHGGPTLRPEIQQALQHGGGFGQGLSQIDSPTFAALAGATGGGAAGALGGSVAARGVRREER